MKDFRKGGKFGGGDRGGRGGFGGKPSFGGSRFGDRGGFRNRDDRDSRMFQATCSDCGKQCEVPFRPTGEKPVYCKECFSGSSFDQSKNFTRKEYQSDSSSMSRPPHPTHAQPFVPAPDRRIDELKKQVEFLHTKLDRIIRTLEESKHAEKKEGEPISTKSTEKDKTGTLKKVVKKAVSKKK